MILASGHNTPDFSSCLGAGMYGGGLGGVGGGGGSDTHSNTSKKNLSCVMGVTGKSPSLACCSVQLFPARERTSRVLAPIRH